MTDTPRSARARTILSLVLQTVISAQVLMGTTVNLTVDLPGDDKRMPLPWEWARAVSHGPLSLTMHAIVGLAILVPATVILVLSVRARRAALIAPAAAVAAALVAAALMGMEFMRAQTNAPSLMMAAFTAIALVANGLFVALNSGTARVMHPPATASLRQLEQR